MALSTNVESSPVLRQVFLFEHLLLLSQHRHFLLVHVHLLLVPGAYTGSILQLNVSALYGIGGASRSCSGGVYEMLGGIRGFSDCILCQKRLRLS